MRRPIAQLEEKSAVLEQSQARTVASLKELEGTNAALQEDVASREQAHIALKEEADGLRLERSLLEGANAQLEEESAVLEQSHARAVASVKKLEDAKSSADEKLAKLERDHADAATRLRRVVDIVSGRRSHVGATVVHWDRELDYRRHAVSELAEIIFGTGVGHREPARFAQMAIRPCGCLRAVFLVLSRDSKGCWGSSCP